MTVLPLTRISMCLFIALSNLGFAEDVKNVPAPNSREFMFIYPTIFGPAIGFQEALYGTGFGLQPQLADELRTNPSSVEPLKSYEGKQVAGNLIFYPGMVFVPVYGLGLPVVWLSTLVSGSAYQDLGNSVSLYNGDVGGKVTFNLKSFGYQLRWKGVDYGPHAPPLLDELNSDPRASRLIGDYLGKSSVASFLGWTGTAFAVTGVLLGALAVSTSGWSSVGYAVLGGTAGLVGVAGWTSGSLVGTWAEADLVQAVRTYNRDH